jgi:hypothetical protein
MDLPRRCFIAIYDISPDTPAGTEPFGEALARLKLAEPSAPAGAIGSCERRLFDTVDAVLGTVQPDTRYASLWDLVHASGLAAEKFSAPGVSSGAKEAATKIITFVLRSYVPVALKCAQCSRHWNDGMGSQPSAPSELFAKTVALHNDVNALLGKTTYTQEEARAAHAWAFSSQ